MTTPAFRNAMSRTAVFEDGWSDDPVDRGGKTKYGVTEATWNAFHKPLLPEKRIEDITKLDAEAVFWKMYWVDAGLDDLDAAAIPQQVLNAVFDAGVHHGPGTAAKMLQVAYNTVRYPDGPILKADGVLGPLTRGALTRLLFKSENERALLGAMALDRGRYMSAIIAKDDTQRRYIRGWFGRIIP